MFLMFNGHIKSEVLAALRQHDYEKQRPAEIIVERHFVKFKRVRERILLEVLIANGYPSVPTEVKTRERIRISREFKTALYCQYWKRKDGELTNVMISQEFIGFKEDKPPRFGLCIEGVLGTPQPLKIPESVTGSGKAFDERPGQRPPYLKREILLMAEKQWRLKAKP